MKISSYKLSPQLRAELGISGHKKISSPRFKFSRLPKLPWKPIGVTAAIFLVVIGIYVGIKKSYDFVAQKNEQAQIAAENDYKNRLASMANEVTTKGTDAYSFVSLSQDYLKSGDAERAVAAAELATQKDPSWRDGFVNLGQIYLSVNQFDKAKVALVSALSIDPIDGQAHYLMSLTDQELKDQNGAKEEFAKAKKFGFDSEIGG